MACNLSPNQRCQRHKTTMDNFGTWKYFRIGDGAAKIKTIKIDSGGRKEQEAMLDLTVYRDDALVFVRSLHIGFSTPYVHLFLTELIVARLRVRCYCVAFTKKLHKDLEITTKYLLFQNPYQNMFASLGDTSPTIRLGRQSWFIFEFAFEKHILTGADR